MNKAQLLAEAISVQDSFDQMALSSINDMQVPESYTGPRLEDDQELTKEWYQILRTS